MQEERRAVRVAVASATFAIDRPYLYTLPEGLRDAARVGMRLLVPFGRGDRPTVAVLLSFAPPDRPDLKEVCALLDEEPVLSDEELRLALFMRERYFCTLFDALQTILPAGMNLTLRDTVSITEGAEGENPREAEVLQFLRGRGGKADRLTLRAAFPGSAFPGVLRALQERGAVTVETAAHRRVSDRTELVARLLLSEEEAERAALRETRSHQRAEAIRLLAKLGGVLSAKELRYHTGVSLPALRALEGKGVLTLFQREVLRRPELVTSATREPNVLNPAQNEVFLGLSALMDRREAACALLYGVTGSGKTEVYLHLIQKALSDGKSALMLVPEIALTPQMLRLFSARFGDQVAVLHSALRSGERFDEWKRVRSGAARVVIGTRSAVFAPLHDLGLVILDEEGEGSYKSESAPCYHARDIAKFRCARKGALLVLGSATPSVESAYLAETGVYHSFSIPHRFNEWELPEVLIADMREELRGGNGGQISSLLRREIEKNLERGEQTILFLNRRGSSRFLTCGVCGSIPECPRCSVHLTYHSANGRLMCHYCGHSEPAPALCPSCGGKFRHVGAGTQKVEEELAALFPDVPVLRMDADTISPTQTHDELLRKFERRSIPILIGTQMVARGLDFPNVTLVGVLDADLSLCADDFRAGERTFSLLTQVVGRAGRGLHPGRAVLQTFTPEHEIITAACRQDYRAFYRSEIGMRRLRACPPFSDLLVFNVSGESEGKVIRTCRRLRTTLEQYAALPDYRDHPMTVLGPAPAPVLRVNLRYRYRVILSCTCDRKILRMAAHLLREAAKDKENRGLSVTADLNPNG